MASLGNRHDGKKGKKQKHVNKKNDIFPHGNYRQYYGNVERKNGNKGFHTPSQKSGSVSVWKS